MQFLALERDLPAEDADFAPHAKPEAARVWELYQAGIVREMYFRADRSAAVLVLECADIVEARAALASLPMVQAGLIEFEIIPLAPYPGFARLFAPKPEER
ncbi:MAG: superoxide dismutase [Candidatus Zixiibacteriota bacterium]|nr:MAG: superoxide dismutase [candidate division Zixibacteria bacterium]